MPNTTTTPRPRTSTDYGETLRVWVGVLYQRNALANGWMALRGMRVDLWPRLHEWLAPRSGHAG
jgi:hypothetical protein